MTRKGWLLFIAISVIWGIAYLFIKIAVRELDPAVVVFVRAGIAAVVLLPIAASRNKLPHRSGNYSNTSFLLGSPGNESGSGSPHNPNKQGASFARHFARQAWRSSPSMSIGMVERWQICLAFEWRRTKANTSL